MERKKDFWERARNLQSKNQVIVEMRKLQKWWKAVNDDPFYQAGYHDEGTWYDYQEMLHFLESELHRFDKHKDHDAN